MGTCPGEGGLSTVPPRKGAELGSAGGLLGGSCFPTSNSVGAGGLHLENPPVSHLWAWRWAWFPSGEPKGPSDRKATSYSSSSHDPPGGAVGRAS